MPSVNGFIARVKFVIALRIFTANRQAIPESAERIRPERKCLLFSITTSIIIENKIRSEAIILHSIFKKRPPFLRTTLVIYIELSV